MTVARPLETEFRLITISLPATTDAVEIEQGIVLCAAAHGLVVTRQGSAGEAFHLRAVEHPKVSRIGSMIGRLTSRISGASRA